MLLANVYVYSIGHAIMFEVAGWAYRVLWIVITVLVLYLFRANQLLSQTPDEVRQLSGSGSKLPPKLERRYIVAGGSVSIFI